VWSADEIRAMASFCVERDLILLSDEIHCDLVFAILDDAMTRLEGALRMYGSGRSVLAARVLSLEIRRWCGEGLAG
jgi:hypothetical protein